MPEFFPMWVIWYWRAVTESCYAHWEINVKTLDCVFRGSITINIREIFWDFCVQSYEEIQNETNIYVSLCLCVCVRVCIYVCVYVRECEWRLTHWGWVTHICVGKLTIIGSDDGLSPGRHRAIIWTNAGILLIGPLGINFCEILIGIQTFSFKKMHLKMSSAKWRPFCLGLN